MRKRLLIVGLLVVGVAMLSGCALLDSIFGGTTPGGGSPSSVFPISGRMKFSLAATVWRDDGYTGKHTYAGNVAATFWSGAGSYSEDSRKFTAQWDGGDFYDTWFVATLSEDQKSITSFEARQTQINVWGGYTYYHRILGVNVPFSHIDGNSRYYRIEGTAVRAAHLTDLEFKVWAEAEDPLEWIEGGPTAATGSVDDYIEIRLDYQNAAVAP